MTQNQPYSRTETEKPLYKSTVTTANHGNYHCSKGGSQVNSIKSKKGSSRRWLQWTELGLSSRRLGDRRQVDSLLLSFIWIINWNAEKRKKKHFVFPVEQKASSNKVQETHCECGPSPCSDNSAYGKLERLNECMILFEQPVTAGQLLANNMGPENDLVLNPLFRRTVSLCVLVLSAV